MIRINENDCVGCGACVRACPAGFELIGEKARVKDETAPCVADAIAACPQSAIVRLGAGQVPAPQNPPGTAPPTGQPTGQGFPGTVRRPVRGPGQGGRGRRRRGGRRRGRW